MSRWVKPLRVVTEVTPRSFSNLTRWNTDPSSADAAVTQGPSSAGATRQQYTYLYCWSEAPLKPASGRQRRGRRMCELSQAVLKTGVYHGRARASSYVRIFTITGKCFPGLTLQQT